MQMGKFLKFLLSAASVCMSVCTCAHMQSHKPQHFSPLETVLTAKYVKSSYAPTLSKSTAGTCSSERQTELNNFPVIQTWCNPQNFTRILGNMLEVSKVTPEQNMFMTKKRSPASAQLNGSYELGCVHAS